jgi:hypothetical protein
MQLRPKNPVGPTKAGISVGTGPSSTNPSPPKPAPTWPRRVMGAAILAGVFAYAISDDENPVPTPEKRVAADNIKTPATNPDERRREENRVTPNGKILQQGADALDWADKHQNPNAAWPAMAVGYDSDGNIHFAAAPTKDEAGQKLKDSCLNQPRAMEKCVLQATYNPGPKTCVAARFHYSFDGKFRTIGMIFEDSATKADAKNKLQNTCDMRAAWKQQPTCGNGTIAVKCNYD